MQKLLLSFKNETEFFLMASVYYVTNLMLQSFYNKFQYIFQYKVGKA